MGGRGAKSSSLDEVNHSGKSMPKGGSGCGTDTGIESLSGSKACRGAFGRDNIGLSDNWKESSRVQYSVKEIGEGWRRKALIFACGVI